MHASNLYHVCILHTYIRTLHTNYYDYYYYSTQLTENQYYTTAICINMCAISCTIIKCYLGRFAKEILAAAWQALNSISKIFHYIYIC